MRDAVLCLLVLSALVSTPAGAQTLINLDFGVGSKSAKSGFAASGQRTNDFWNLYRHYDPRYIPGQPLVHDGRLDSILHADGSPSPVSVRVTNAPGVWGNNAGDPMWDTYLHAPNGSNLVLSVSGLPAGRYHLFAYGHAEADVAPEQNSRFTLVAGPRSFGPLVASGGEPWRAGTPMREHVHYTVFRDIEVPPDSPLTLVVAPGPNGIAVLNGLQILSRGTSPPLLTPVVVPTPPAFTNLLFREIHYQASLSPHEARFAVRLTVEAPPATNPVAAPLFLGNVAVLSPSLPQGWTLSRQGPRIDLVATTPGLHSLTLEVIGARLRDEPWHQTAFEGPAAAIATLAATAADPEIEIELLAGTPVDGPRRGPGVRGVLGADRRVALRWQSRTDTIARTALVTVETHATVFLSPAAVRHTTRLRYDILQAPLDGVRIELPAGHSLTRIEGAPIRDWRVAPSPDDGRDQLSIVFLEPVEATAELTIHTEQPVPDLPGTLPLTPPRPLDVQRETGSLRLLAEDLLVRVEDAPGLRQVNAQADEVASFRFVARPASARLQLDRWQPEVAVASRLHVRLDESRLVARHDLDLTVTRAGIYSLDLSVPEAWRVTGVVSDDLDDWKLSDAGLHLTYLRRVLGPKTVQITFERALPSDLTTLPLRPVRVREAASETTRIGIASAAGFRARTRALEGLREIPVTPGADELLAYRATRGDWSLDLDLERLSPRVVAEAFHLVTLGEGLLSGAATLRYSIFHQGIQQLRLRVPGHWRNIEFTGPGIRRQDRQGNDWTLTLQEKAWGAYTLVLTYDHPVNPRGDTVVVAAAQPLDTERVTGHLAIANATPAQVEPGALPGTLRPIDPSELPSADRALVARPILLAWRATDADFQVPLTLIRHDESPTLDAVTDRTQLTTVLTDAGELLTQAGFMVKNNDRQYQRFHLPRGAELWGAYVNGDPVKAERDGDWLLVALPRRPDRDEPFAVDLKYAESIAAPGRFFPQRLRLAAPGTDVPSTYAEWELFVPDSRRLSRFAGSMTPVQGTTYTVRDAWDQFLHVYRNLWLNYAAPILFVTGGLAALVALIVAARRSGFPGMTGALVVIALLAVLLSMLLPALSKAKAKASTIKSVNNLKQFALAARLASDETSGRLPDSIAAITPHLGSPNVLVNPDTGRPYTYLGAGRLESDPDAVLAYGEMADGRYAVALVDGSVQIVPPTRFTELLARLGETAAPARPSGPPAPSSPPSDRAQAGVPVMPAERFGIGTLESEGVAPAAPTHAGMRSIRVEIPRAGQAYRFTKILNVRGEPFTIEARMVPHRAAVATRMVLELAAFLTGLVLVAWQWRRPEPRARWLAFGALLVVLSTTSLFLAWRALHLVLIFGAPLVLILVAGNLLSAWRRRRSTTPSQPPPPSLTATQGPAITLLVAACAWLNPAPAPAAPDDEASRPIAVTAATYTGRVADGIARFEARLDLHTSSTNRSLPLFGPEVAIHALSVTEGSAVLWRDRDHVGIRLPDGGSATIELDFVLPVAGNASQRQLAFRLPPAWASEFILTLDEPDAVVAFPSAVAYRSATENDRTVVRGIVGASDRLALSWTPRVRRASEVEASVLVDQIARATVGPASLNLRSTLDFQITQGEVALWRVRLPAQHRLLRVHGQAIRTWDLTDDGSELRVELLQPVTDRYALALETERPIDSPPASLRVELPQALDVRRQSGVLGLLATDDVSLVVERAAHLQRIDPATFPPPPTNTPAAVPPTAYRFVRPEFDLALRVETIRPDIEAAIRHAITVGPDRTAAVVHLDYTIRRLGVFTLQLALPDGYDLEEVRGDTLRQSSERTLDGTRLLELALRQRTLGKATFQLRLQQSRDTLPAELSVGAVHPIDASKITLSLAVGVEPGVAVKTASLTDLSEVPVAALPQEPQPEGGALLAYRHLAATPSPLAPWSLSLTTEAIPAWVRAESIHVASFTEALVTGRSQIRFQIQNAPVQTLRLAVPDSWRNVEILGPNLRRRDRSDSEWTLELQARTLGTYDLTLLWEELRPTPTNAWSFRGFTVRDVERETGFLALSARSPLQVVPPPDSPDFTRADTADWPAWAAASLPDSATAPLVWRFLGTNAVFNAALQRFSDAEVLQALIDRVHLTTVMAEDGQAMTQLQLAIRNNGRQHLEVQLPAGAVVWSAFVADQPVRPRQRDGRLLLPIDPLGDPDALVELQLTYVQSARFPRHRGRVRLDAPRLDLPLKDARWDFYLPPDYEYGAFGGSMQHAVAELQPLAQDFTLAEYRRQEVARKEASLDQVRQIVTRARDNLAAGRYGQVSEALELARGRAAQDAEAEQAVRLLEDQVLAGQGSNLIRAQNEAFLLNSARFDAGAGSKLAEPADARLTRALAVAAGRQAQVIQRVQAVATPRLQPLRITLPTRGLRHSFTQVLQTEIGKPLTVEFKATHARRSSSLTRFTLAILGFLTLWLAAAVCLLFRTTPSQSQS
ncbi:MAG: hypothetical protein KF833_08045 [Verrucomicrobiae bacterium]|nr:hypothetical protein [Verrucomicrobiae bacterium]